LSSALLSPPSQPLSRSFPGKCARICEAGRKLDFIAFNSAFDFGFVEVATFAAMDHTFERNPGIPLDLGWINTVQVCRNILSAPLSQCGFDDFFRLTCLLFKGELSLLRVNGEDLRCTFPSCLCRTPPTAICCGF
jgi:hypothetical protein